MLVELRVRNMAVIRDLSLELSAGLNILSGETGAGKSIIVGALGLLLGDRASSDSVRTGEDRATVAATFDVSALPEVADRLLADGFQVEDGGLLILRREVQAGGRSRAWVNGSPATVGTLGEIGSFLVDFHGQHEHQTLLRESGQREILDALAGAGGMVHEVAELHAELTRIRAQDEARRVRLRELTERSDLLRFQLDEIRTLAPETGEDDRITAELSKLEHAEDLARGAAEASRLLYSGEASVSEQVAEARETLRRLLRFDAGLQESLDQLEEIFHGVTEVGRALEGYATDVEVDPRRTEELRKRADLLVRLRRKYGPELDDVLDHAAKVESELVELDEAERGSGRLQARIEEVAGGLKRAAYALTETRKQAAGRLQERVEGVLPELGFDGATFRVDLEPLETVGPAGAERIRFVAALNAGFEPQPLHRIASGGELSRMMLCLKSILASEDRVPTLVFDEIDAGVGGGIANAVARKLREVARSHQVFVITHLPQIAALGDHHLRVEKGQVQGETETTIRVLEGADRVRELARMLGGDPDSETSRDHAREMLARIG